MNEFRMLDTKRPDGCYVRFEQIETPDSDASPNDYLFQDPDYREQDQERLDSWRRGDWYFVGIQARAHVCIVRNGVGTTYELTSPGLWGIESDSDASYLQEVFADECDTLRADLAAMSNPITEESK